MVIKWATYLLEIQVEIVYFKFCKVNDKNEKIRTRIRTTALWTMLYGSLNFFVKVPDRIYILIVLIFGETSKLTIE